MANNQDDFIEQEDILPVEDETAVGVNKAEQEKAQAKKNIKGLLSGPKTKPVIIMFGLITLVGFGVGSALFSKGTDKSGLDSNSTVTGAPTDNVGTPGNSTTEAYNRLSKEDNIEQAKQAENAGGSHMDVTTVDDALIKDIETKTAEQPLVPPPAPAQPVAYPAQQPYQQQQRNVDQENMIREVSSAMTAQAQALVESWSFKHHSAGGSAGTVAFAQGQQGAAGTQNGLAGQPIQVAANGQTTPETLPTNDKKSDTKTFTVKFGTITYGITGIDVNTDSSSNESTATILSGPLMGATLMGSYSKGKETVTLKYNKMVVPWSDEEIKVSVLAIDPNTTSKDIATDVDHHYLERYGLLMASAFASGLGEAAQRANSVVTTNVNGTTNAFGELNTSQTIGIAAGRVGDAVSRDLERQAPVQTTVMVAPDTQVGLLFMENAKIPVKPQ